MKNAKKAKILATVVLALGLLVLGMAGFNGCAVQAPMPSANQIAAQAQKENAACCYLRVLHKLW